MYPDHIPFACLISMKMPMTPQGKGPSPMVSAFSVPRIGSCIQEIEHG